MKKRVKGNKLQLRQDAQDQLMIALQKRIEQEPDKGNRELYAHELNRIERLFGYEVGSWYCEDFSEEGEQQ